MMDEYTGQGGSYLVDKKTGKRKLAEVATNGLSSDTPAPDSGED
jgi:hypothetical protein